MVPPSSIIRSSLDDSSGAIFGGDREQYRYLLWRQHPFTEERQVTFVMLNPSTADENVLDPTLRRCWSFAQNWGYNRMEVVNLFAYRATNPDDMIAQGAEALGPDNDWFIRDSAIRARLVVCGWGVNASPARAVRVATMLRGAQKKPLHHLRLTKSGAPGHPLYLPLTAKPVAWEVPGEGEKP